jgi:hypothetical protein
MDKKWWQSNTIRLALLTIVGAAGAYLSGQVDVGGAVALIITGILQIMQREYSLKKEPASPSASFPGIDAGPGGTPGAAGGGQ